MGISIGSKPPPSASSVQSSPTSSPNASPSSAGPVDSFTPAARTTSGSAATGSDGWAWKTYSKTADEIKNMSADDIKAIKPDDIKIMTNAQMNAYMEHLPSDPKQIPDDIRKALVSRTMALGIISNALSAWSTASWNS